MATNTETQKPQDILTLEPAGFWRRFGAFVVDMIIIGVLAGFLAPIWGWGIGFYNISEAEGLGLDFLYHPINLVSFLIGGVYNVGFWLWRDQTIGKMLANIKVLKCDGGSLTPNQAIIRYLSYFLSAFLLFFGFIIIAFDIRKQGLHDKLAETVVVKVPETKISLPEAAT
jgi:uncharacterized RDD family membrane protein YckC